jgi:signal transduction histidine kinase
VNNIRNEHPDRLSECFDELVRNSIRWFDKSDKKLEIVAIAPAKPPLPPVLDAAKRYVVIHFRDNGLGTIDGEFCQQQSKPPSPNCIV